MIILWLSGLHFDWTLTSKWDLCKKSILDLIVGCQSWSAISKRSAHLGDWQTFLCTPILALRQKYPYYLGAHSCIICNFFAVNCLLFFETPARFSNPPQIGFCCNNYSWSLEISFLAFGFRQELSNLVSREVWKTGRERAALLPMSKDARGRRKYRIICHHWEETWINYVF